MDENKAMKRAAEKDAIEDNEMLVFQSGWKAALEWRDSQAGEPRYWVHNFANEGGGEEFFDHPTGSDCPDCVPLYLDPPAAQINQQLVRALELAETEMRYAEWGTRVDGNLGLAEAYKAVIDALAAVKKHTK